MINRHRTISATLAALALALAVLAAAVPPAPARAGQQPGFTGLLDYSQAWYDLYTRHNDPIDEYNDANYMELYALTDVNIPFIASHEYEELNPKHADGRFEGNLPYSGYAAFVDQAGTVIDFGFQFEKTWDGNSIAEQKGDAVQERGRLDLAAGHMTDERAILRGDVKIERDTYEYKLTAEGAAVALAVWGDVYTYQGDEMNRTQAVYMRLTESGMEFVMASGFLGVAFEPVSLGGGEMTPEEAVQALEAAGFTIQVRGGVRDGALTLQ